MSVSTMGPQAPPAVSASTPEPDSQRNGEGDGGWRSRRALSRWGMVLPSMISLVGIYLMRVYVDISVPRERQRP